MYSPQPVTFRDGGMTADGVVLVSYPDDQNYVESSGGIIKEF